MRTKTLLDTRLDLFAAHIWEENEEYWLSVYISLKDIDSVYLSLKDIDNDQS